jgi:hypothetical protein
MGAGLWFEDRCGALLTNLLSHPGSGRRQAWYTNSRRMGAVYSKRLFRSIFSNLYAGTVVRRLSSTGPPTVKW